MVPLRAADESSGFERASFEVWDRTAVVLKSVGIFRRALAGCEAQARRDMREAQALLRRAGRTDFIMVAGRCEYVALHEELRREEESIDLQ